MIHEIRIEQMAVIESLEVHFDAGFTVLTGETGVGKSLLIQALSLVAGDRANAEAVRADADEALIEAQVSVTVPEALTTLREQGYLDEGDQLLVRRLLRRDGNHRIYLNGRLATAGLLQETVAPAVEIYAQHAQQKLLDQQAQRRLLDRYAEAEAQRQTVAESFDRWREVQTQIEQLSTQAGRREQELDYLRFQLDELTQLDPQPGELEKIREDIGRVRGGAELIAAIAEIRERIHDGDGSALDHLFSAQARLTDAGRIDPRFQASAERLDAFVAELQDWYRELPEVDDDVSEARLPQLESRLSDLERLVRKHGDSLEDVLAAAESLRAQIDDLEHAEAKLQALRQEETEIKQKYLDAAEQLSAARRAAAQTLAADITDGLHELEMPHAQFAISGWGEGEPARHGIDRITFALAANPGDPPKPLKQVASGGELSRILLVVHSLLGMQHDGGTVVLDEADAGIGGKTAVTVGEKMRALGERAQVLVVTHTPQVAGQAHQQVHLEKGIQDGRACTVARSLSSEERIHELAGMLGLRDTATAINHAKTLLAQPTRSSG